MRGTQISNYLNNNIFAVEPKFLAGLLDTINSGKIDTVDDELDGSGEKSCYMTVSGGNAIINISGAMIPKHTFISSLCGDYVSYAEIANHIDKAEANASVKRIIFRVNTNGGAVDGADAVGEKIFDSKKETVTYFENMGASAGVWVFSSSDQLFASEMTFLGSIGVIATYRDGGSDSGKIVSMNASQKDCSLNGDCREKIQTRINDIESLFYSRVTRNTGMSAEAIKSNFKSGDVVMASEAEKFGFIKKTLSFDTLLSNLKNGDNTMSDTTTPVTAETPSIEALTAQLGLSKAKVTDLEAKLATVTADLATARAESKVSKDTKDIVALAFEYDASKEDTLAMLEMSIGEASLFLLKSKQTAGTNLLGSNDIDNKDEGQNDAKGEYSDIDADALADEIMMRGE